MVPVPFIGSVLEDSAVSYPEYVGGNKEIQGTHCPVVPQVFFKDFY